MKLLIIIVMLFPVAAEAFLLRENFKGIRPLGMGNAFIAIADDKEALWYNPAGLAKIKGVHGNLFDLNMMVDSQDTLKRIGNAAFHGDFANLVRRDIQAMQFTVKPTFIMPYFGLQFYDNFYSFTDFRDMQTLDARVDVNTYNDIGVITGFAIPFGQYLSAGMALKIFQRSAVDTSVTFQDLLTQMKLTDPSQFESAIYDHLQSIAGLGYAAGINLGVLFQVPLMTKNPRLFTAITIDDLGFTSFYKFGNNAAPPPIPYRYNAGVALRYALSKTAEFNVAADFRDYYSVGNVGTIARRINVGCELRNHLFGIRTGIHQGYPALGLSITYPPHTQIHLASYANELGTGFHERMQRLYTLELVIGFNPL